MTKKNYYIHIVLLALSALMLTGLAGCIRELEDIRVESDHISFSPYMTVETKSASKINSTCGQLGIEIEDWKCDEQQTKASPTLLLEGDVNVTAYLYDGTWSNDNTSWTSLTNSKFSFDGYVMTSENKVKWSSVSGNRMRVYAYAPYTSTNPTNQITGVPSLSFTPNEDVSEQVDLIAAKADISVSESKGKSIALGFNHALTGIRFKAGFACTAKSVEISGVCGTGTYFIGGNWALNEDSSQSYVISFPDGKNVSSGDMITDNDQTLMLIPQTLTERAEVTLVYSSNDGDKTITASLNGRAWEPGKLITYTLNEEVDESNYVYFDLAAGNVTIEPGTNKVTGYVFEKDNTEPTLKKYTHSSGKTYYIYQSTAAKRNDTENPSGVVDGNNVILPVYPPVTYDGKAWADFITNNTEVDEVIAAWDNELGAGKGKGRADKDEEAYEYAPNQDGAAGAVREADREATKNRIHVKGNVSEVNLIIDNIYSSYQQKNSTTAGEHIVRTRSKGGISFLPSETSGNSTLTINLVGDSRLGCVNYQNNNPDINCLVFQGTGSLTVADVDYFRDSNGLGSNRSCSVIGGKDSNEDQDDVYNIVFNSGVIYAGASTSACTAIGGGGNGNTKITINGGTITAVAATTGTAIGGGTGLKYAGGKGDITITAGNVYAYNYKNSSKVPSSAIGGAGSENQFGELGKVTITGGYVYAYSESGTAIGGGSSSKRQGGDAEITISGGYVVAKTGDAGSASIGGGTGGNQDALDPESKAVTTTPSYGGTASINISNNPTLRTGSIGGGATKHSRGNKGYAVINVAGGDISGQFIMEAGTSGTPQFTMSGGVISNSDVDSEEYSHVSRNGGAVYMEDGAFTMTGGTIRDCSADYGGAVYIKKGANSTDSPSFEMSGGQIYQCTSKNDGGAVYLEDGTVTVSGSAGIASCQSQGNGGAICVKKTGDINPSFSMVGGNLMKNYAASNGGAVHLEGGMVTVSGGTISGNIALDGNGGGISINSGNFDMPAGGTAMINANAALVQNQKGGTPAGNGGGVYVTSTGSNVEVNLLSGTITGNSSTNTGGGIGVDVSTAGTAASVIVGTDDAGPEVSGNVTLLKGAGLYVNGEQAYITINAGTIKDNSTVGYVDNPDVMNDGGMVTLNGGDVKSVNVIYKGNGGDTKDGQEVGDEEHIQRIVTDTNNKLAAPTFYRNGYKFVRWNTRADGLGVDNYSDGQTVKRSSNLILYAIWELN